MKQFNKIYCLSLIALVTFASCKKDKKASDSDTAGGTTTTTTGGATNPAPLASPVNPATAATQGFFLDNSWQAKTFATPTNTTTAAKPGATATTSVYVDMYNVLTKVSPYVYGNNINPYTGQMVNQPTLMGYITDLAPNILRFPGGSLSDVYFWNASPSQTPANVPARLLNYDGSVSTQGYWYGNNTASYTMTVEDYYQVLQQTNSTGIITVNYGYARYGTSAHPDQAAAHLAANWVRYDKGRTKYWEIGNENYGNWEAGYRIDAAQNKDGQPEILTGALYGQHFKVFADSMRKAAAEVGATIKIGAVLVELASTASNAIPGWDAGVLGQVGKTADFYIVHNYYTPYNTNSAAASILATPSTVSPAIMNYVKGQVQSAGAAQVPVALTEWNIQAVGATQNVSNVAGLHAAMNLGEVIKNQFGEASRWDLANGYSNGTDQGMFANNANTADAEPGATAWNPHPAFYYMYFFQRFFGDRMLNSTVTGSSDLLSYASSFSSGEAGIVLVNRATTDEVVNVTLSNFTAGASYYYYVLNGGTDNGDFSRKTYINGNGPSGVAGGPSNYNSIAAYTASPSGGIKVTVPARGAVYLAIANKN